MMHFNLLLAASLPLALVSGCVIPESAVHALDAQPGNEVQTSDQQLFLAASSNPSIWEDQDSPISCKKVCPLARTVNNKRHHNKHIWNKAEVGGWLDIWLKAVAYNRWPERVAKNIWPHKVVDIHCADMHSTECGPVTNNCYDLCSGNETQAPGMMFYLAAQQFHDTANTLHEFFQDLALNDLLDLHQIVKDWDGSPHTTEGDDINSILSSCLGIGASVAGAIPGGEIASAALGTISGIFSLAESASGGGGGGGGTPTTHMEEMIQTLFGHNQHLINKMLKDVFGEGDPTEIPPKGPFTLQGAEEEEVKPELDAVTLAKHTARISKVFENGKWLFDSISKHVGHFKKETKRRLTQSLGIYAMNYRIHVKGDYGYVVVIDTKLDSQEKCAKKGRLARWTRGHCFNLFWFREYDSSSSSSISSNSTITTNQDFTPQEYSPDNCYIHHVGRHWVDTFDSYKLKLEEYYENVYDCATSHEVCHKKNHKVKWKNWDGKGTPKCLFHTRLWQGEVHHDPDLDYAYLTDVVAPCEEKKSHQESYDFEDDECSSQEVKPEL